MKLEWFVIIIIVIIKFFWSMMLLKRWDNNRRRSCNKHRNEMWDKVPGRRGKISKLSVRSGRIGRLTSRRGTRRRSTVVVCRLVTSSRRFFHFLRRPSREYRVTNSIFESIQIHDLYMRLYLTLKCPLKTITGAVMLVYLIESVNSFYIFLRAYMYIYLRRSVLLARFNCYW